MYRKFAVAFVLLALVVGMTAVLAAAHEGVTHGLETFVGCCQHAHFLGTLAGEHEG